MSHRMYEVAIVCSLLGILGDCIVPLETGYTVFGSIGVVRVDSRILEVLVVDTRGRSKDTSGTREGNSIDEKPHSAHARILEMVGDPIPWRYWMCTVGIQELL